MDIAVVGGGISGVSAAYIINKHTNNSAVLIEQNEQLGGKSKTIHDSGYTIETGSNGFLDNKEEILNLVHESGFEKNMIQSRDESRRRFIFSNDKLFELPENPVKLLFNNFLTPKGKFGFIKEAFVPMLKFDETLEHFVIRRLGREILNKLIGPMSIGVYAGDPSKMSMDATFPRIKTIERQYGSLVKGLFKLMREKKADTKSASGPFSAKLLSFKDGLSGFISHLSKDIKTVHASVDGIKKRKNRFVLHTSGDDIEADAVVFALPAYALSAIFKEYDDNFSDVLNKIEYAPITIAALGFDKNFMQDVVNSFGYLFDMNAVKDAIGVLFDSSIFDYRAAQNKLLVRVIIGGAIRKNSAYKDNIIETAIKELQRSAGIFAPFEYAKIIKHKYAIPQYGLDHKDILKSVDKFESENPGLFITGNAFYGVSLNDCVKSSYNVLNRVKSL